jgi:hypothetical protein
VYINTHFKVSIKPCHNLREYLPVASSSLFIMHYKENVKNKNVCVLCISQKNNCSYNTFGTGCIKMNISNLGFVMLSERMRTAGQREINASKILVRKSSGKRPLGDQGIDGRIILRWVLKK